MLLVDDEADLASIRFVRKTGDPNINQGTIADQIDELRDMTQGIAFLQVTATPYSLYLQPEGYEDDGSNYVFKPKRPALPSSFRSIPVTSAGTTTSAPSTWTIRARS